jgi:hypothetical protein
MIVVRRSPPGRFREHEPRQTNSLAPAFSLKTLTPALDRTEVSGGGATLSHLEGMLHHVDNPAKVGLIKSIPEFEILTSE